MQKKEVKKMFFLCFVCQMQMSVEVGNALYRPRAPLLLPAASNNCVIKECGLKEIEIDMDNHNGSSRRLPY